MTGPDYRLPDPRRYGARGARHVFDGVAAHELRQALSSALAGARDDDIAAALSATPSRIAYGHLWGMVSDIAHHVAGDPGTAVVARIFALPLVIVTGSRRPICLPGIIPDIAEVRAVLEQHGALGRTRNFGMGNALCSYETLSAVKPSEIYAWTAAAGSVPRDLAPSPIDVAEPGERVHLRFLVGAGITPASDSSFIEAASNIATWGMPLTRALAAQFSQPGVDVLPLPRPPLDLLRARHAGREAQLEAAFNLFASNAVRNFRRVSGDPVAVISAHDDGDIRVTFSSPFDDTMVEGFRWPLHPLDEIEKVTGLITDLLAGCRLNDVRVADDIRPALSARGETSYPTVRDMDGARNTAARH